MTRRTVVNRQKDRPGQFELLRGIFDQPVLWKLAAQVPAQTGDGRRRKLPTVFYLAMPSFAAVWDSFSAAEIALAEPEVWTHSWPPGG